MENYHALPLEKALEKLGTDHKNGLSDEEAKLRLEKYGPNSVETGKPINIIALLLEQFASPLVAILFIAALVSFFFEKGIDAILIISIVILNGLFGFVQNYNAEKSIEALKKIGKCKTLVLRGGKFTELDASELVPGDIILLKEGDKVPADARIFDADEFYIDESILTGESVAVHKSASELLSKKVLAEQRNMCFMDTLVVRGQARTVVVQTGNGTEIGKIAKKLWEIKDTPTRFHAEVSDLGAKLGRVILVVSVFVAGIVFIFHNLSVVDTLIFAVSVAVAAIPEGLPAVVTLSLAFATRKMLEKKSLVRKLTVLEDLGSVNVICTDKTGTLTENRMTVQEIYANSEKYSVTGTGYSLDGDFFSGGKKINPKEIEALLFCGLACNDTIQSPHENGTKFHGDPTEIALVVSAKKAGLTLAGAQKVREIAFSSPRRRMATIMSMRGKFISYAKGAPEQMIESCSKILINGKVHVLGAKERQQILAANRDMTSRALRVLAFAKKEVKTANSSAEDDMIFLGLQGLIDPARTEVAGAIAIAQNAGIRVVMLTGDNKMTAQAIAAQIGLFGRAIDGSELLDFSRAEFEKAALECTIFSRVSPEQKFEVLRVLKSKGFSVAMTGDGVNDSPALKVADVGIAMGIRGSDVAKEASDIVVLDDNFATIVEAVKYGRGVFDNIQKFVFFLLACNLSEVIIIVVASAMGKLIFTPAMLLWINLVTDGFPALALGADEPRAKAMNRPPRGKGEKILTKERSVMLAAVSIIIAVATLLLFTLYLPDGELIARSIAFNALVVFEFAAIAVIKKQEGSSIFSGKWLVPALLVSFGLQLLLVYTPLSGFFGIVPPGIVDWAIIFAVAGVIYFASYFAISALSKHFKTNGIFG